MASEYLKKKYQDVKPDEPIVLTKKEKRQNWWDYHKFHLLIAVLVIGVVSWFIHDMVTQVHPDYQVSYLAGYHLMEEDTNAVEERLQSIGMDVNGDGKVAMFLGAYQITNEPSIDYPTTIKLTTDLAAAETQIFILEDPVGFQKQYGIFMQKDGSFYDEGDDPADCLYYRWSDCPAVADLDCFADFYIARRAPAPDTEDTILPIWNALIEGAEPVNGAEE